VAVTSDVHVLSMFDPADQKVLAPHIHRHVHKDMPGQSRGIPPSNWAKYALDGHTGYFGVFTYKTLHRCNNMGSKVCPSTTL
jgi:hypothetical protein